MHRKYLCGDGRKEYLSTGQGERRMNVEAKGPEERTVALWYPGDEVGVTSKPKESTQHQSRIAHGSSDFSCRTL